MRFSFVILHYNSLEETIKCVESIRRTQKGTDYKIVIVDNNSPDGSGKKLERQLGQEEDLVIILSEKNLGFARGNNLGFHYAKYKLKSDFIILQNADTMVLQEDFQKLVIEEFHQSGFAVLGPFIKTPHPPFNSNPGAKVIPDIDDFKKQLLKYRLHFILTYLHLDGVLTRYHLKKVEHILARNVDRINERAYNVWLHGCFWVFSKKYIDKFDGLNDKTFLFNEEPLLFLRLRQNNLVSVYLPQVVIFHQEDASTDNSVAVGNKKNRFIYKCKIQSTKVVIDEIVEYKKTLIDGFGVKVKN